MVIEGAKQGKNNFYSVEQRHSFRSTLVPPPDTAIWLGRCAQSNLLHGEARNLHVKVVSNTQPSGERVCHDLCCWVLIIHMREGPWEGRLLQVRPIEREQVDWPPRESFNDRDDGLQNLRRRFAVGVTSGASGSE